MVKRATQPVISIAEDDPIKQFKKTLQRLKEIQGISWVVGIQRLCAATRRHPYRFGSGFYRSEFGDRTDA